VAADLGDGAVGHLVLNDPGRRKDSSVLYESSVGELGEAAGWGAVVGLSLVAGAVAATLVTLRPWAAETLTAFGGGILFAAVALELVPEADAGAGVALTAAGLFAGTTVFVAVDAFLDRDRDTMMMRRAGHAASAGRSMEMPAGDAARGESLAAGLVVDGVPESLALGLTVAEGEIGVALLAGIVLGNMVEAYGATQPLRAAGWTARRALTLLAAIGLALALATTAGGTILADASSDVIGTAQAFAGGAILAVVTITIVPHAFDELKRRVAFAMVVGFVAGYLLS
jgi:ZIP family zinc transporter